MASHGSASSGTPTGPLEARQYTPYRPPAQQHAEQHPGAAHGSQHYQQSQHVPQDHCQPLPPPQQAGHLSPAMAGMTIADGMAPAPLRVQRKPLAGPGTPYEGSPATPQQPQSPPSPHPQAGYFSLPTPAPSPYVANPGAHPPPSQHYGSYYPPNFPTAPLPQQWHGTQGHMGPGQPTPPAVYEMGVTPGSSSPHTAIPPAPFQPVQTFIAELQGSEPLGPSGSQGASTTQASPLASVKDANPEPSTSSQLPQDAKLTSVTDLDSESPGQPSAAEPTQGPSPETVPSNPSPTTADSEGLILVEKPPPPDHEGLIPFHVATDSLPGDGHMHQSAPIISSYPGHPSSPPAPSHGQQPYQQLQQADGATGPFLPPNGAPQRPVSTSMYPESNTNLPVAQHWSDHPYSNSPPVQQPPPLHQPSTSSTSPSASLYPQHTSTPGPYHSSATATPPLASTPPISGYPSHRPHSATFPIQSHSQSPTLQGGQMVAAAGPPSSANPQQPFISTQSPQIPTTASYTPAAFPTNPHTLPAQTAPSGPTYTSTFPASQPSAIPSMPSITTSQHGFSAIPQPHPSKPGRHSGASTSFGGFANSVFSKDTVKWSKKTASRFGGAIKTAASTAHAAATNAQAAASQAAALHRQKSVAAAQMRASSNGGPQPPASQSQTWSGQVGAAAPASAPYPAPYGQPVTNPAQTGMGPGAVGSGYTPPQHQVPPAWPSGAAVGPNPANAPGTSAMPLHGAGTGSQPGPPAQLPPPQTGTPAPVFPHGPYPPQQQLGAPVSGSQPAPLEQPPHPSAQLQHSQSWPAGSDAVTNAGMMPSVPGPGSGTQPDTQTLQPPSPQHPTDTPSLGKSQGGGGQSTPPNIATPPPGSSGPPASTTGSSPAGSSIINGAGTVGQPGQLAQPQPVPPANAAPPGSEWKPPQAQPIFSSPGNHEESARPPTHSYAQGPHPHHWPSGSVVAPLAPATSPAVPVPGVTAQPAGPQLSQQTPHLNVFNQQSTWNPASPGPGPLMPVAGAVPAPAAGQGAPGQQPWGVGPGQSWNPTTHGPPAFAPGHSVQPQHGTGVPPPQHGMGFQPAQYGTAQPHQPQVIGPQANPWAPSMPSLAPHPGAVPAPAPGPAAASWQQPPPPWHVPGQQQPWGPAGVPMQNVPPFSQANGHQQPAAWWNPVVQQPQPWAQPPGINPATPTHVQWPGHPPVPATSPMQYPPQTAFPQSYGTPPPQPQWQPYAQGPAYPAQMPPVQMPPAQQSGTQQSNFGMGTDHPNLTAASQGGGATEQPKEENTQKPQSASPAAPVPTLVGDMALPAASSQPASGDSVQESASPGVAASTDASGNGPSPTLDNVTVSGENVKGEPAEDQSGDSGMKVKTDG